MSSDEEPDFRSHLPVPRMCVLVSGGTACLTLLVERMVSSNVAHNAATSISRIREVELDE